MHLCTGTISGVCTFGYGFKKRLIIDGAENFESPLQILGAVKEMSEVFKERIL